MPEPPHDPMGHRTIRIPEDLWRRAQATARRRGETVSEAIRKFLEWYADPDQKEK